MSATAGQPNNANEQDPVKYPSLEDATQASCAKYARARKQSIKVIAGLNVGRNANNRFKIPSHAVSVRGGLLDALLEMRVFGQNVTEEDDVTDAVFEVWLKERIRGEEENRPERLNEALSKVWMRVSLGDGYGTAINFLAKVRETLSNYGLGDLLESSPKTIVAKLLEKLAPTIVKEKMEMRYELFSKDEKEDYKAFENAVIEICQSTVSIWPAKKGKIERKNLKRKTVEKSGDDDDADGPDKTKKKKKKSQPPACLNPRCKEDHWLSACPNTKEDEKKKLIQQYKEKKAAKKNAGSPSGNVNSVPVPSCVKAVAADPRRGLFDSTVRCVGPDGAALVEYRCISTADTGSVTTLAGCNLLDDLNKSATSELSVHTFATPRIFNVVINEQKGEKVVVHVSHCITVQLILDLRSGPLVLDNVNLLITTEPVDGIILGRDVLVDSMGLDIDSIFSAVCRKNLSKIDCSNKPDVGAVNTLSTDTAMPRDSDTPAGFISLSDDDPKEESVNGDKVCSVRSAYPGVFYGEEEYEDSIDFDSSVGAQFGEDTEEERAAAIEAMIERAIANGLSVEGQVRLREICAENAEVFCMKMPPGEPADVEPLKLELKPDARPVRCAPRRYADTASAFISATTKNLERVDFLRRSNQSKWGAPAHPVKKPESKEGFRYTIDYSKTNSQFVPIVSQLPNAEQMMQGMDGSKCFAKLDLLHAFWTLPLAEESRKYLAIQTPVGVFEPTRMPQGYQDSNVYFHNVVSPLFDELGDTLKQFIDDGLAHSDCEKGLFEILSRYFAICKKYRLKVSVKKTDCYLTEASFCGRIVSANGIKFDPKSRGQLLEMKLPTTGGDLLQFVHATSWMRLSIPEYAEKIAPLTLALKKLSTAVGSNTRRALKNKPLAKVWNAECEKAFYLIQEHLRQAVLLAHYKADYQLTMTTDASDTHWSAVCTQVPKSDLQLKLPEQRHEPLGFLSGSFNDTEFNWSTVEKEAYAVVTGLDRLDYLFLGRLVHIHTDHRNLLRIFSPTSWRPNVQKHIAGKLIRWAQTLCRFRYYIYHIKGVDNVWSDLLTKWAVRVCAQVPVERKRIATLLLCPISPEEDEDHSVPCFQDLQTSQEEGMDAFRKERSELQALFSTSDGLLRDANGKIYIPSSDRRLLLRLLIVAHCGAAGHRGIDVTYQKLSELFYWTNMKADVAEFVKSCLSCLANEGKGIVPRPYGRALHGLKPNDLLHMDYLYIGPGEDGASYILILKDDAAGALRLVVCRLADALTTAEALIQYFADFGVTLTWVSDRGSHFRNYVIELLRRKLHVQHHFTHPYCPWANGSVETICNHVLKALKALRLEFRLPKKSWPSLVPLVQSALNSAVVRRLGNRSARTAFTGLPPSNPLTSIVVHSTANKIPEVRTISEVRLKQCIEVDKMLSALDDMHREVNSANTAAREQRVASHNRRTHVRAVNFDVGDYVLRGVLPRNRRRKFMANWQGPFVVTQCMSDYIFEIKDLLSDEKFVVHGTRLKFYRHKDFEVSTDVKLHLAYQENELFVVDSFQSIRRANATAPVELKVRWKGFEASDDSWELADAMMDDVNVMTKDYLKDLKASGTPKERMLAQSILTEHSSSAT